MRRVLFAFVSLGTMVASGPARADVVDDDDPGRPRGRMIFQPELKGNPDFKPTPRGGGPSVIIYMNRSGGTYYGGGWNDSRTNQSSIISGTKTLAPYPYDEASWQQVMKCFRDLWAPFNVEVTDVDPGNVPHVESVVTGSSPQSAGFDAQTGGVAPFTCGILDTAIVYTFAGVWGNSPRNICETAAQESAHAFGLDHENYCPDPMTYKFGCGDKYFRDYDAPCGEFSNRNCYCGGSTQNSHRMLLGLFGARPNDPPTCAITNPANGATVRSGFVIDVDAHDDINLDRVELWVNGQHVRSDATPPYGFYAPSDLEAGTHTITARAVDTSGMLADSSITVNLVGPCTGKSECASHEVCVDGRCATDLGHNCTSSEQCASNLCATGSDGSRCTQLCDPGASNCPSGFDCLNAGSQGVCWPGDGWDPGGGDTSGGCGCVVGARRQTLPLFLSGLALGLAALVVFRRRA